MWMNHMTMVNCEHSRWVLVSRGRARPRDLLNQLRHCLVISAYGCDGCWVVYLRVAAKVRISWPLNTLSWTRPVMLHAFKPWMRVFMFALFPCQGSPMPAPVCRVADSAPDHLARHWAAWAVHCVVAFVVFFLSASVAVVDGDYVYVYESVTLHPPPLSLSSKFCLIYVS